MDYSQLLIDVQKKASVSVQSVRDLKLLKEEIEVKSDLVISYNTLRRVFGFLSQNTPSTNTLNKLSMFLGFNTYSAYLNHKELYNDWHFHQTTLRMMVSDQLTEEDILVIRNGILDSNKIITITGPPGTSKTFIACYSAVKALLAGKCKKIILSK